MAMQLTTIGPLGDETRFGQDVATKLLFIGAMTGKLEEAYKILMLVGVDVRFCGLTRELEAEVWERILRRPVLNDGCYAKVPWQAAVQRPALDDALCVRWLRGLVQHWPTPQGD